MGLIGRLLGRKSVEDLGAEQKALEAKIKLESARAKKAVAYGKARAAVTQRKDVLRKLKAVKRPSRVAETFRAIKESRAAETFMAVKAKTSPRIRAFEKRAAPILKKAFVNIGQELSGVPARTTSKPKKHKRQKRRKAKTVRVRKRAAPKRQRVFDPWTGKYR